MSKQKKLKKLLRIAELTERLPLPGSAPRQLREPLDLVPAFVAAWNEGDADALADLFVEDADFVNVVGLWWTSRRSIRRAHAQGFERIFPSSTLVVERVALRRVGEDVAIVHCRWGLTGQVDPEGEPAGPRRGVFTAVVQRLEDGTWACLSLQNTDMAPDSDTYLATDGGLVATSYIPMPSAAEIAGAELVDEPGD